MSDGQLQRTAQVEKPPLSVGIISYVRDMFPGDVGVLSNCAAAAPKVVEMRAVVRGNNNPVDPYSCYMCDYKYMKFSGRDLTR